MEEKVGFTSSDGVCLSGVIYIPALPTDTSYLLVHPFTYLGGSCSVMTHLANKICRSANAVCFAIDLRGAGSSSGSSTLTGYIEADDVASACRYIRATYPEFSKKLFLVGYSAGACISGSAIPADAAGFIGIAYPCGYVASILLGGHPEALRMFRGPKLFISGSSDLFTSTSRLEFMFGNLDNCKFEILPGLGHFDIIQRTNTLANLIIAFSNRPCNT